MVLVCRRRRRCCRRRLCVLGGGREREGSTCYCSAAGVCKPGGGRAGRGGVLVCRRRRRYVPRRLNVLEGAGQGRGPPVTAPPPALASPAAGASGGEGCWCVAAGVDMAGGGTWRRGWRARRTTICDCSAAGVCETGGSRVLPEGERVCRRRRLYGRRRSFGGACCRRRLYGRRQLCVYGGGGGHGRRLHVRGQSPALASPATGVWNAEGTGHVAAGIRAPTRVGGLAPVAGVFARLSSVAENAGDPPGVFRIRGRMHGAQK